MCEWCLPNPPDDPQAPDALCPTHQAEFEGISLDQLELRDAIHYAEWLDSTS